MKTILAILGAIIAAVFSDFDHARPPRITSAEGPVCTYCGQPPARCYCPRGRHTAPDNPMRHY